MPEHDSPIVLRPLPLEDGGGDERRPFLSEFQAWSACDLRLQWHLRFYELVGSDTRLRRAFCPGVLEARPIEDMESVCVWRGAVAERPARRLRRALADADGSDGERGDVESDSAADAGSSASASSVASGGSDAGFDAGAEAEAAAIADDPLEEKILAELEANRIAEDKRSSSEVGDSSGYTSADYVSVPSEDIGSAESLVSCGSTPPSSDGDGGGVLDRQPHRPVIRDPGMARESLSLSAYREGQCVSSACIRYNQSNQEFYAVCPVPSHGRCIATRTVRSGVRPAQGRPLGFLAAWVLQAEGCTDKSEHLRRCRPSKEARRVARRALHHEDQAEVAATFVGYERARRADEDSEPDDCP